VVEIKVRSTNNLLMDEWVPIGSRLYGLMLVVLLFSRGMDFISTWVATPRMVLEGNPIARRLGWRWGIPVNVVLCFAFALWPFPAIVISTTSLLVAARNFQSAWLMRSMGEENYRDWHRQRIQETTATLFLFCLFGQTGLIALIGGVVIFFAMADTHNVLLAIGFGILGYAVAVAFYTMLGMWRMRRSDLRASARVRVIAANGSPSKNGNGKLVNVYPGEDVATPGS
jgi:hypothetical protein